MNEKKYPIMISCDICGKDGVLKIRGNLSIFAKLREKNESEFSYTSVFAGNWRLICVDCLKIAEDIETNCERQKEDIETNCERQKKDFLAGSIEAK